MTTSLFRWRYSLLFILAAFLLPQGLRAQHFECVSNTGANASLIIETSVNPTLNGVPFETGDEIALFTPQELCAGFLQWREKTAAITIWGDDPITSSKDGFATGDTLSFRIWDASSDREYTASNSLITVQYDDRNASYQTSGRYVEDALYVLTSLTVQSSPGPLAAPTLTSPADEAADLTSPVTLEWNPVTYAASYQIELDPEGTFNPAPISAILAQSQLVLDTLGAGQRYAWRVRARDAAEQAGPWSATRTFELAASTNRQTDQPNPRLMRLLNSYPNPANGPLTVEYELHQSALVVLEVYNALGKRVGVLGQGHLPAGHHTVGWMTSTLAPGLYLLRLQAGPAQDTRTFIRIK